MGRLSTHVLDTARGKPAAGVRIMLYRIAGQSHRKVKEVVTNADGRTDGPMREGDKVETGTYELVFCAGDYLRASGAKSVVAGGGLEQNAFYTGIYGGLDPSGFCVRAAAWPQFFASCGYSPSDEILVLRRDLIRTKDPVNAKLLRHRRHLNLIITDRPTNETW